MLNVQTLGILLRALRDGNAYPEAPRAPSAVNGVARVSPVASDPNESLRGEAAVRTLPTLQRRSATAATDDREPSFEGSPSTGDRRAADARAMSSDARGASQDVRTMQREAHSARADVPARARPTLGAPSDAPVAPHETRLASAHALATSAAAGGSGPASTIAAAGASTALAISPTGRWLTGVAHHPVPTVADTVPATLPLTDAAVRPPALETALRDAIATSGVFYEAHLARWIADDLTLAQLAQEPQASWTPTTIADATSSPTATLPHDAEKLAVVARQLETLDARAFVWSGMPWPGQQATIEIGEDERDSRHGDARNEPREPAWKTRLTMTLPSLGTVEATLALRGNAIELRLVADDAAQARLAFASEALRVALTARSLELAAFATGSADGR